MTLSIYDFACIQNKALYTCIISIVHLLSSTPAYSNTMQIDNYLSSQNITSKNEFQTIPKRILKKSFRSTSHSDNCFKGYPVRSIHLVILEEPQRSPPLPGAVAGPTLAIEPVMSSITPVNTTVQQYINRSYDSTC